MTRTLLPRWLLATLALSTAAPLHATDILWRLPDSLQVTGAADLAAGQSRLAPGADVILELPPGTPLRWRTGGPGATAPQLWLATDGALFRQAGAVATGSDHWLPPAPQRRRVRLLNAGPEPITLQAWTGDTVEPAATGARGELRATDLPLTTWRVLPGRDLHRGQRLEAGQTASYRIAGPARLQLETRMLAATPGQPPAWTLTTRLDDAAAADWPQLAPLDTDAPLQLAGQEVQASRPRTVSLDLPAGMHTVSVASDRPVLLQASAGATFYLPENDRLLYPRRQEAGARDDRLQGLRQAVLGGDAGAATAEWRASDPAAALLLARWRDSYEVMPAGTAPLTYAWLPAPAGGQAGRFLQAPAGQTLRWSAPDTPTLELEVAAPPGATLQIQVAGQAAETVRLLGPAEAGTVLRGRLRLAATAGQAVAVTPDREVLLRLRALVPRLPTAAPVPASPPAAAVPASPADAVAWLAAPDQAPAWAVPLARRLALRLPPRHSQPCTAAARDLPTGWAEEAGRLAATGRTDDALRLLARARAVCGNDAAADALAAQLYTAGDFSLWQRYRLDDLARRQGEARQRLARELGDGWRAAGDWPALETLGATRLRLGDHEGMADLIEALAQQDEDELVLAACRLWGKAATQAPATAFSARSCAAALSGAPATPWRPLAADSLQAGGLAVLESVSSGRRSSRYLAPAGAPLVVRLTGPRELRIEARRRTPASADADGKPAPWLTFALDGSPAYLPFTAPATATAWRLLDSGQPPGVARLVRLHIPAGSHTLTLGATVDTLFDLQEADAGWPAPPPPAGAWLDEAHLDARDIARPPVDDVAGDRHLLRLWWWASQRSGPEARGYQARLHALAASLPPTPWRSALLAQADRNRHWQREARITDSAGSRPRADIDSDSPATRRLNALLGADAPSPDGAWLGSGESIAVLVDGVAWKRLRFTAQAPAWPAGTGIAATLSLRVGSRLLAQQEVDATNSRQLLVAPPSGLNRISASLDTAEPGARLALRVEAFDGQRWQPLSLRPDRNFLVGTREEPVTLEVDSAEWLRIDEPVGNSLRTSYHFQATPGSLSFAPAPGERERVLRIYSLREQAPLPGDPPPAPPLPADPALTLERERAARFHDALAAPVDWTLQGPGPAARQRTGDDTVYTQYSRKRDLDDDDATRVTSALTLGWQHRSALAAPGLWQRSDVFVRRNAEEATTLGTRQQLAWHPRDAAWYATAEVAAHAYQARDGDDLASLAANTSWRHEIALTPATTHRFTVEAFLRGKAGSVSPASAVTDNTVWSAWKEDHRQGWRLAERWRHQPHADTDATLDYGVNGNEALADALDSVWVQPSARLWRQGLLLEATLGHQRFLRDDDRARAFDRTRLGLEATWRAWGAHSGWFLQAGWQHEFTQDVQEFAIGAGYSLGAGPRAHAPSALPFRALEIRRHDLAQASDRLDTGEAHVRD